jgi:hypothetical protein
MFTGDHPIDFATTKTLEVYLDQINTMDNADDGAPSMLLAEVGLGKHAFGNIVTQRVLHPEFKLLRGGK